MHAWTGFARVRLNESNLTRIPCWKSAICRKRRRKGQWVCVARVLIFSRTEKNEKHRHHGLSDLGRCDYGASFVGNLFHRHARFSRPGNVPAMVVPRWNQKSTERNPLMSATNHLSEEEIHAISVPGVHASMPVADALRLSEKTGLPVVLTFNGKQICISWSEVVSRITNALLNGLPS